MIKIFYPFILAFLFSVQGLSQHGTTVTGQPCSESLVCEGCVLELSCGGDLINTIDVNSMTYRTNNLDQVRVFDSRGDISMTLELEHLAQFATVDDIIIFLKGCKTACSVTPPPDPPVKGTGNQIREEVNVGSYAIAANSYYTYVQNAGCVDITVNGETVSPGGTYQCGSQYNYISETFDCCPAVTIDVPADGEAWFSAFFPSN